MNAQVTDLRPTIVPRSDQLNADDMLGGPMTITVAGVRLRGDEQPVAIDWVGGDGRPFLPCKSMRRLLVEAWGPDGNVYPGRQMTLYRDSKVTFGKDQVGGIRISHLSHIEREMVIALTVTRGKRAPYKVSPLKIEGPARPPQQQTQAPATLEDRAKAFLTRLAGAADLATVDKFWKNAAGLRTELGDAEPELLAEITQATEDKRAALQPPEPDEPDDKPDLSDIPGLKTGADLLAEQAGDDDGCPGDRG